VSTGVEGRISAVAGARQLLAPEVRFRPWRVLRSVPAPIWLITVAFGLLLGTWSVLVPQYHAPDEPHHVDAVMRLAEGKGWPPTGHALVSPDTVGSIAAAPYGTREKPRELAVGPFTEADAPARSDRPDWDELTKPGQPAPDVQQMLQHPPLYYLAGAALVKLPPGTPADLRFDLVIGLLRLMSVLMVAPLPLLAWACADRLTESRVAGRVATLVPLAIPMLTHIGASVNNDALLVLTGALTTLTLCYVLRGDTSMRTACWLGAFLGAAMLSKSLGVVFVPMAIMAYLLAWWRARKTLARTGTAVGPAGAGTDADAHLDGSGRGTGLGGGPGPGDGLGGGPGPGVGAAGRRGAVDTTPFLLAEAAAGPAVPAAAARFPWRPLLVGSAVALACGAWWFVVNIVRYHAFQPSTPGFTLGTRVSGWGEYADVLVNGTILRWWGDFGWFEAHVPELGARIGTVAVTVLAAVGIAQARGAARRVDLLLMLWPTLGLFGLMTLQSGLHFHRTSYVSGISGRYLFAGVVSLAVAIGAGAASTGWFSRFTPPAVLAAALTMQGTAGQILFRRWWEGPDGGPRAGLSNLLAWSPWPQLAVEITLGLCALALLTTVAWSVVFAIRPEPRDPGERDERATRATLADPAGGGNSSGMDDPADGYDWFGANAGGRTGAHVVQPTGPIGLSGLGLDDPSAEAERTMSIPRRPGAHRHRRT